MFTLPTDWNGRNGLLPRILPALWARSTQPKNSRRCFIRTGRTPSETYNDWKPTAAATTANASTTTESTTSRQDWNHAWETNQRANLAWQLAHTVLPSFKSLTAISGAEWSFQKFSCVPQILHQKPHNVSNHWKCLIIQNNVRKFLKN